MSLAWPFIVLSIACVACARPGCSTHRAKKGEEQYFQQASATGHSAYMSEWKRLQSDEGALGIFNLTKVLAVLLLALHPAVGWRSAPVGQAFGRAGSCHVRPLRCLHGDAAHHGQLCRAAAPRCSNHHVDGSTASSSIISDLQAETWEFLKSKRLVGKHKKFRPEDTAGSGAKPRIVYGRDKAMEKRALKRKILAGEELAEEERKRLEELKALNKAKKEEQLAAQGPILKKTQLAFRPCNMTGIIDNIVEKFPTSSCGTDWRLTRGKTRGEFFRSMLAASPCNLLRVKAPLANSNDDDSVHLSLDLSNELPPGTGTVDASNFAGLEVDIFCPKAASYPLLLKTPDCNTSVSYYRAFFETVALKFARVRIPWSEFVGIGPGADGTPLDVTQLRRVSLELGRGKDAEEVAVAGIKFLLPISAEGQSESQANTWKFLKSKQLVGKHKGRST